MSIETSIAFPNERTICAHIEGKSKEIKNDSFKSMEANFEELVSALPLSSSFTFGITDITHILEKQNQDLYPSFIINSYKSLLILESWAWKLLTKDSYQWVIQPHYVNLFRTLAVFNKNLIFYYENIENETKACLLMPDNTEPINGIFEQIERTKDLHDCYIDIICLWLYNLSLFVYENPEFDTSSIICYMNEYIAQNYLMTEEFLFYLDQLVQPKLPQAIFTNKQLFYIKTCSFSLNAYLTSKAQTFPYTSEEIMEYIGHICVQIIEIHSHNIDLWTEQFLTCITHLIGLISACCWWGGEKLPNLNLLFSSEQIIYAYINALIRIISYKPFYSQIAAQWVNDETILIDICLFSLKNIVQVSNFVWFFRSKVSLPDTLLTIAELSIHDKICLRAYIILGEIFCNDRLKDLKITDNLSLFFYDMLEHAWQHPSKKYKQIPIYHLLRGFLTLSKIDAIQQKTADLNKIPLFIDICEQYPVTFDILWALSFNQDIQQQLRSNTNFMAKLIHLAKECDNEQMRKMTHGILWNLESIHQGRSTSPMNADNLFDIMISYSHKDETICKQIYEELTKAGYRVWIDFDQMHGNVMDAMAQAIERSTTIIICMSEQYRRSNYCRAEAHYAFQRQLKIVPILLQNYYQPDGWLLFLIGQLLYVDFTKIEFSRAIDLLLKEIKADDISESLPTPLRSRAGTMSALCNIQPMIINQPIISTELPKNIQDWNRKHVNDWLVEQNLLQMADLLRNCDGQGVLHLNDFLKKGDINQVMNLLQEESLRRNNESLSLVELSCFRSLIDQHKRQRRSNSIKRTKFISTCCVN